MAFEHILFDLDGTLIDPAEGLGESIFHAFDVMGLPKPHKSEIGKFIGPPITWSFMEFCGLDKSTAEEAVNHFRQYYNEHGIYKHSFYPGIKDMLGRLQKNGKKISLATSKPIIFARRIIEDSGLENVFTYLSGVEGEGLNSSKAPIVKQALDFAGTEKPLCVMVGDRKYDIEGAKANKIKSIGVLYGGYASTDELNTAGADYIAKSVDELEQLLLA